MNPNPATYSDPTTTPTPTMYGFPCADWTLPRETMTPLTAHFYTDALAVLTEPAGEIACSWADEQGSVDYREITTHLTLPQVRSLAAELPDAAIARLTGGAPTDEARQAVVRALYVAPDED